MKEYLNLDTVDAYLASVAMTQGNIMPAPLVIISDDNVLYDEPAVLEEIENALSEERDASLNLEIVGMESYSGTLITVTFASPLFENTYRINIPRQLVQVGYMYNVLLKAPLCGLMTESERHMNQIDDNVGEFSETLVSSDILIRLSLPEDLSREKRLDYSYVMNNLNADFAEGVTKENLREISPKVSLTFTPKEANEVRAEILRILMGLIEGDEDALISLYTYAEYLDHAKTALDNKSILNEEERKGLIFYELVSALFGGISPENLALNIEEVSDAFEDDDEDDTEEIAADHDNSDVFTALNLGLEESFNKILSEFKADNPEAIQIDFDSSSEDRIEYLTSPSNSVPLLAGLETLSDRINLDMLFSRDWNEGEVTEEDYTTRGEHLIIMMIVVTQRLLMFAKAFDNDETIQDAKSISLSVAMESLTKSHEDDAWFLSEALYQAGRGQLTLLQEFLALSVEPGTTMEYKLGGPFGLMLHWLGHSVIHDQHNREALAEVFKNQPLIGEFIGNVFDNYDGQSDEDKEDPTRCFVSEACLELEIDEDGHNLELVGEFVEAFVAYGEYCLSLDNLESVKGSDEWNETLGEYLNRVLRGNH